MVDTPNQNAPQPSRAERLAIPEHALAALEYQARRHYRRWQLVRAERLARRVVRFDVGRADAWFVLGDIAMRRLDWASAHEHFQQAVDCRRSNPLAWCRGGEALLQLGRFEEARRWLQRAIDVEPARSSRGARRARKLLARQWSGRGDGAGESTDSGAAAPTRKLNAIPALSDDRRHRPRGSTTDHSSPGD